MSKFFASSEACPMIILAGLLKSLMASPSFKNSGLKHTSILINDFLVFKLALIIDLTKSVVPTGTVDLTHIIVSLFKFLPIALATFLILVRSVEPFSSCGVPTAINIKSAFSSVF